MYFKQRRDSHRPWLSTPPLPKSEPPDPPYEVIEFSSEQQQYTNTSGKEVDRNSQKQNERKCDLCGSSNAQFQCDFCARQKFCVSCDQMYHRHPKRQTHVRKRLPTIAKERGSEPPLPPKGELSAAPVPPPRRHKRPNRVGMPSPVQQHGTVKKDGSLMGSLRRFVGGIHTIPSQTRAIRSDSRSKFPQLSRPTDFDQQSGSRDSGYLDWDTESRHRSGSFSAFNGPPAFSPLAQAQSMAQLNCPTCHVHGMSAWDWNRSQMNLNAFPPWQAGIAPGNTWHGSVVFPPTYRMPTGELSRRGSLHSHRHGRRARKFSSDDDDTESDLSVSDDRKSRRRTSPSLRAVSPAMSRRSRCTVPSDTEEEVISRKSDRRFKKRGALPSREPSPALSRRSYRKKYDDDDGAMSMRSTSSRRNLKSPGHRTFLRKNARRSSTDSDDELTSDRDVSEKASVPGGRSESRPVPRLVTSETQSGLQGCQKQTKLAKPPPAAEKTAKDARSQLPYQSILVGKSDWECEHCTYLNANSSRVCDVCCKSRAPEGPASPSETEETAALAESMKNLNVSAADGEEKKKGDREENNSPIRKTISTGTSPPPQTISTQTYEVPSSVGKRNRSFSCDDYADWNPTKKSNSIISFSSDKQIPSSAATSFDGYQSQSFPPDSPVPTEYMKILLQKHVKHGFEIVKLLKEAEQMQFNIEDLTVALAQCGDMNPIQWLSENWSKMIDAVVSIATNYGREQSENTIGTISTFEARAALRLHNGDIWAAATECIRQRQKKYAQLMSRGCFTREDVVTVLTANHGDLNTAYTELNKCQLKPFLMKIWGPPQGSDNESGDMCNFYQREGCYNFDPHPSENNHSNNFKRVESWLHGLNKTEYGIRDSPSIKGRSLDNRRRFDSDDVASLSGRNLQRSILSHYKSCDNLKGAPRGELRSKKYFHRSVETLCHRQRHSQCFATGDKYEAGISSKRDLEEDIRNYIINEYIKFQAREQINRLGSDTEDDVESDLPMDSFGKEELERASESYHSSNLDSKLDAERDEFVSAAEMSTTDSTSLPNETMNKAACFTIDKNILDQLLLQTENLTSNISSLLQLPAEARLVGTSPSNLGTSVRTESESPLKDDVFEKVNTINDEGINLEASVNGKLLFETADATSATSGALTQHVNSVDPRITCGVQSSKSSSRAKAEFANNARCGDVEFPPQTAVKEKGSYVENYNKSTDQVLPLNLLTNNCVDLSKSNNYVSVAAVTASVLIDNSKNTSRDVQLAKLVSSREEESLFKELNALYLLAKARLDDHIIDTKDTTARDTPSRLCINSNPNFNLNNGSARDVPSTKTTLLTDDEKDGEYRSKLIRSMPVENDREFKAANVAPPFTDGNAAGHHSNSHLTKIKKTATQVTNYLKSWINHDQEGSPTNDLPVQTTPQEREENGRSSELMLVKSRSNEITDESTEDDVSVGKETISAPAKTRESAQRLELMLDTPIPDKIIENPIEINDTSSDAESISLAEASESSRRSELTPAIPMSDEEPIETDVSSVKEDFSATCVVQEAANNINDVDEEFESEIESEAEFSYEEVTESSEDEPAVSLKIENLPNQENLPVVRENMTNHMITVDDTYSEDDEDEVSCEEKSTYKTISIPNVNPSNYIRITVTDQMLNAVKLPQKTDRDENLNQLVREDSKQVSGCNLEDEFETDKYTTSIREVQNQQVQSEDLEISSADENSFQANDAAATDVGNEDIFRDELDENTENQPSDRRELLSNDSDSLESEYENDDEVSEHNPLSEFSDMTARDGTDRGGGEVKLAEKNELNAGCKSEVKTPSRTEISSSKELAEEQDHQIAEPIAIECMDGVHEVEENSFQARARRCLSEGLVSTYDQAELAVQLMDMTFDRSQSVDAAIECSSIQAAITYLQQECQLCAERFSMKQMISMLECEHRCCLECAEHFFSVQINEKSIDDCVCPFCNEPRIQRLDADAVFNYFSNLDILLKTILKPRTHELFQQKLRDRTLMRDPNFRWCSKCSFGFIAEFERKHVVCPSCDAISCTKCGKLWEKEHEGKTCEQYNQWLISQNDHHSELSSYLEDYGVTCPHCDTKFILVKGGCMHLTCTRCKYEFCSDCFKPFSMGSDCKLSDYCAKLGLHAHHPRNCLFYLRDKEPQELKQLLLDNSVELNMQPSVSQRCTVQLQKETEDGMVDTQCGAKVEEFGLCRTHCIEYFANLIRKNKIDPVVIFDLAEVLQEFRRRGKSLPVRLANTFEHEYRRQCIQIVKEELPLE